MNAKSVFITYYILIIIAYTIELNGDKLRSVSPYGESDMLISLWFLFLFMSGLVLLFIVCVIYFETEESDK